MATLRGHLTATVSQYPDRNTGVSCFGLPGQGRPPALCNCDFTVHVAVYDDGSVYVGLAGNVNQNTIVSATYPVKMCVSPDSWSWYVGSDGTLQGPNGSWADSIKVGSDKNFVWNFSCGDPSQTSPAGGGYVYVGDIRSFHGDTSGHDGYLYLSGTGTYTVTSPTYPTPVQITIPSFNDYINPDYFPWAIYKGGNWLSCNRSGGYVQKLQNGAWTNKKNSLNDGTVKYFNGSTWIICPKIGAGG